MTYIDKLITGIRWQFRKKSISRVFREIWRDVSEMALAFCKAVSVVLLAPILILMAAPIRILVWMLSPFICPFMKVNTEVWVSLDSTLKK